MQDRSFPYEPLIDLLRQLLARQPDEDWAETLGPQAAELSRLLPELAGSPSIQRGESSAESEGEKRRLFEAFNSLFFQQAGSQALLLIVEDLHWSDQASLEYLLYLVRRIAAQPILLIMSVRDGNQPGLNELLGELDREPGVQQIRLQPFTRPVLAELLQAVLSLPQPASAEFVEAVYNLTEGNPFFAEEICTALIASGDIYLQDSQWRRKPLSQIEIPDSLQRAVQQRLDRISRPARQLIDLAAVSGRSFDFKVLQSLTQQSEVELLELVKELLAARLVVEESADIFSFRHALTREALYARLLARERRDLHARLVEAIETVHAASLETHLEELAYHASEAEVWSKTFSYAERAGEKALSLAAPHAAAEQFSRAIRAAGQMPEKPPAQLYRLRGQAYDTLGDFDRARGDYEAALAAAQADGDDPLTWRILIDLGLLWASRDYDRSGAYCRQALELAREMQDPQATGHSLNRLGNWLMNRGQATEALEYHQQALARFEQIEDQAGIAVSLDLLAMASNQSGDAAGTVKYYQRAIPILRQLNDRKTLASSLTNLSNYTLDEAQAREAVELAREIGWRSGEAYGLIYLGSLLAYRGELGHGLDSAQTGLELAAEIDHKLWQSWGHITLGLIYQELQALEPAHEQFERGRAVAAEVGSDFMVSFATNYLAYLEIEQGRLAEAQRQLPGQLPENSAGFDFIRLINFFKLALARQDHALAKQLLEQMPSAPRTVDWPGGMAYFYGSLQRLRAGNLAMVGQVEQAQAAITQALEYLQSQGVKLGGWRLQLALGNIQQEAGNLRQAEIGFCRGPRSNQRAGREDCK